MTRKDHILGCILGSALGDAFGGDTDTIASMAGQVAGAMLGDSQLPRTMIARLPQRELIQQMAENLALL